MECLVTIKKPKKNVFHENPPPLLSVRAFEVGMLTKSINLCKLTLLLIL